MKKPIVEITIPVYNEEKELVDRIELLERFCTNNLQKYNWHITIADNASDDNTPIIAATLIKKHPKIIFARIEEKGRGRAVKRLWSQSDCDYCVYMDLDLSTDLVHLPNLLRALVKGSDIAIGSRLLAGSRVEGRTVLREITSRVLNAIISYSFHTHFTDVQCGFKGVNRKVVENLIPKILDNDWFFDAELLIVGEKSGYKIYEEPVHWIDNPGSTVRLVSTIAGDIKTMIRLLRTRPWIKLKNY